MAAINHADIPGWLSQRGAIGQSLYDHLINLGHDRATLDKVIRDTGITVGQKVQQSMSMTPAPAPAVPAAPAIDYSQPWELSYDGKSRDFRDPKNYNSVAIEDRRRSNGGEYNQNSNAQSFLEPLYGYGAGRVNDAARALGIKNINSQREVDQILAQIRGGYPAGAGGGGGAGGAADRSSGQYGDITAAQGEDQRAGQNAADDFADKDPALGGIDPAIQAQLDALMLANMQYGEQLAERDAYWQNSLQQIQNQSQNSMRSMENMMLQQQMQASNTQNLLQDQLASTQVALQNQQRMSVNLANAFVPAAEQSVSSASTGDTRALTRKRKETNSLNDLSIVSGVGSTASLSGLTLA